MAALEHNAYDMALVLAQTAQDLAPATHRFPALLCAPGDSPLHLLYMTPVCTFVRTGAQSMQQHIYDCVTCGLVDGLCICDACAVRCHSTHELVDRGVSGSAYCDCRPSKLCCQPLPAGKSEARRALLRLLAAHAPLVAATDTAGHTALSALTLEVREWWWWLLG